ncbi:hypothetical protein ISS22_14050 [candidate division KSB1 bacterium]|nr:hypothetical protein [candidate division KSB1 bacterium]
MYNVLDQQVRRLAADLHQPAGSYQILWDGLDERDENLPGGTYVVVFNQDNAIEKRIATKVIVPEGYSKTRKNTKKKISSVKKVNV